MEEAMIKAIQTEYAGCLFRSRTEARWAVFFDELGLKWEYEKEGFELPSGRYLPDFWLPEWRSWFEVKGEEPTHKESSLAYELSVTTRSRVIVAIGIPEEGAKQFQSALLMGLKMGETHGGFALSHEYGGQFESVWPLPDRQIVPEYSEPAYLTAKIRNAIKKARSARFEFAGKAKR